MKIFNFFSGLALVFFFCNSSFALTYDKYFKKPKLVVVLMIDQFRADYLTRFQKQFRATGTQGEVGGFQFLMKEGAYFPFAEYDVLQSMTCPGHAMVMTGSHPTMSGIPLNEWFDRASKKTVRCTEDSEFEDSPRRLKTSTVGDELKNSGSKSKVFTVALKERAAIMMGGHRADLAIWIGDNYQWRSSGFYGKQLPTWLQELNLRQAKENRFPVKDQAAARKALGQIVGVQTTFEVANALMSEEKLGRGPATDILAVSLSSHDIAGHAYGPNSQEMEDMTLAEDKEVSKFLTGIKKQLGSLNDVVIVLTGDHGIPPTVDYSKSARIEANRLDGLEFYKKVNEVLDKKFGKPKKDWIVTAQSLNYYLNEESLKERGVTSEVVQGLIKDILKEFPGVFQVVTASEIEKGIIPNGFLGQQLLRQYIPGLSGDIIVIPRPYYMQKDSSTVTHQTGYSYDRSVPLIIVGPNIKKQVFATQAKVLDLAPTLSFILGILPPATAEGRVLSEIFN